MSVDVVRPIIFYSRLFGLAPFKCGDQRVRPSKIWFLYACCLCLFNTLWLTFLCNALFFSDLYEIVTGSFTLFFDLMMCVFTNILTNVAMLVTSAKMSDAYNEIIHIGSTMLPMAKTWHKFLQNVYFLTFTWTVLYVLLIAIADGVMDPFGSGDSISHGLFFFSCEIVPAIFACGYNVILILIGFMYEELILKLRTSIRFTDVYVR